MAAKVQSVKGPLHVSCKYIYQQESGLTLGLELVLWQSPADFITSLHLPKLLELGKKKKKKGSTGSNE